MDLTTTVKLDLTKLLKPGIKLYSLIDGEVEVVNIDNNSNSRYPIETKNEAGVINDYTEDGKYRYDAGECILFPSKTNHDWNSVTEIMLNPPKKGDYLISRDLDDSFDTDRVFIYNGNYNLATGKYGCIAGIDYINRLQVLEGNNWTQFAYRYATEEEIEKFNKRLLEEKGYIFNKDRNKLEFQGRAKRNASYYYIGVDGIVYKGTETSSLCDDTLYHLGNYFLTEEEAKKCLKKLKVVYKECKRWT